MKLNFNYQLIFPYKSRTVILIYAFIIFLSTLIQAQWTQVGQNLPGEGIYDRFGEGLSISGDGTTLAAGGPQNSENGMNRGHVRVFKLINGIWVQQGSDIEGVSHATYTENTGFAVSLSYDGSIVVIGGIGSTINGLFSGLFRVYKFQSGSWVQIGSTIQGDMINFQLGYSVSISNNGNTIAASANLAPGGGTYRGLVRVYENIGNAWIQIGSDINGEADDDHSGSTVELSDDGSTVIIGAEYNDAGGVDRGHARVYKNIGGTWIQQGSDIDGDEDYTYGGRGVSISANGSIVAMGEWIYAAGGLYRGRVRAFEWNGINWVQRGQDILGVADEEYCGGYVSLSADGSTLALGAENNNGGGISRGQVRVYRYNGTQWVKIGSDINGESDLDQIGTRVSLSNDGSIVASGARAADSYRGLAQAYTYISIPDADGDGISDNDDLCPGGDDSIDNDLDGLPDCHFLPAFNDIIPAWKCDNNKVWISHFSNDGTCHSMCVSYNAAQVHINHGDNLGPCNNSSSSNNSFVETESNTIMDEMTIQSVSELKKNNKDSNPIEVYPNPSNSDLYVALKKPAPENLLVRVIDPYGRIKFEKRADNAIIQHLDLKQVNPGIYFLQFIQEDKVLSTSRFIKQ